MADALRNALQRKLVAFEGAGMTEHAARMKARLAKLDREAKPKAPKTARRVKKSTAKKSTKKST